MGPGYSCSPVIFGLDPEIQGKEKSIYYKDFSAQWIPIFMGMTR